MTASQKQTLVNLLAETITEADRHINGEPKGKGGAALVVCYTLPSGDPHEVHYGANIVLQESIEVLENVLRGLKARLN